MANLHTDATSTLAVCLQQVNDILIHGQFNYQSTAAEEMVVTAVCGCTVNMT